MELPRPRQLPQGPGPLMASGSLLCKVPCLVAAADSRDSRWRKGLERKKGDIPPKRGISAQAWAASFYRSNLMALT